jgi:hypothetical protein
MMKGKIVVAILRAIRGAIEVMIEASAIRGAIKASAIRGMIWAGICLEMAMVARETS